jgi:phage terminase large subunit
VELNIELQPKQKLFKESIEKYPVTLFGGAKGGGKSHGLRNIMLIRRFEKAGSHGAIFRRTYPELESNHIRPLFEAFPFLRGYWNEQKKLLSLPNGSTLQFCHCANETDVDLYQGREFHDLAIDEAGHWTETMFRKLQGSNRSSKTGIAARSVLTGNPGGIGHTWLKRIFIEKRFNERERPNDYNFIQALVDDNKALIENDPEYVHRLNTEPNEALRKAYRYGDWDIFAGQFFGEIRREVHFIKQFNIPEHWNRFGSYDFGFNHPGAFGWFAVDEDGNVYLYREFIKAQMRVDQFAAELNRYPDTKRLDYIKGGLDCWASKGVLRAGTPRTIAEEFLSHDITLSKATIDRIQGANQLRNYLAWQGRPNNKPRFYIFDNCPVSFDCLSRMQHDPDRVEDVLKQDASEGDINSGDDAYDMIRYALMSRPFIPDPVQASYKLGTQAWANHATKLMEDHLQKQIERQQFEDRESDIFAMEEMGMEDNPLSYYINKRKN